MVRTFFKIYFVSEQTLYFRRHKTSLSFYYTCLRVVRYMALEANNADILFGSWYCHALFQPELFYVLLTSSSKHGDCRLNVLRMHPAYTWRSADSVPARRSRWDIPDDRSESLTQPYIFILRPRLTFFVSQRYGRTLKEGIVPWKSL